MMRSAARKSVSEEIQVMMDSILHIFVLDSINYYTHIFKIIPKSSCNRKWWFFKRVVPDLYISR